MLTSEVVEFCRGVENLLCIAVRNQRDVNDVQNGLVGFVQLFVHELPTTGTEWLVVESQLDFFITVRVRFPNERRALLCDLWYSTNVAKQINSNGTYTACLSDLLWIAPLRWWRWTMDGQSPTDTGQKKERAKYHRCVHDERQNWNENVDVDLVLDKRREIRLDKCLRMEKYVLE